MKEWNNIKLKNIIAKIIDNRGKSAPISDNGIYPIIEINAIGGFYPDYSKIRKYVSTDIYNSWFRAGHPEENDILIPTVGTIGITSMMDKTQACIAQNLIALRLRPDVNPLYVYYFLKSDYTKQHLINLNIGGVQPSIKVPHLLELSIPLPKLKVQNAIANILHSIDQKIELNRQINDNLEQQAQALYKSWFVDFEPFKGGRFVESELGLIPKGWSTGSIYKYVNVIYGAPYKSTLFNENKEGYPLIRIRDLKTFSPQFYTTEVLPQTEYIKSGDVVAGMDAEFIPCLWQGETGVLNQRCCKFVGKDKEINNLFVLHLVKPELEYVQSYKTGTTVSHLGKADIDRFIVILPDEAIVHQFSKICRPLLDEQNKCAVEIRRLTNLRDALLPKLMSGELKINEIDC